MRIVDAMDEIIKEFTDKYPQVLVDIEKSRILLKMTASELAKKVYNACMNVVVKDMEDKKTKEPKLAAHYVCQVYEHKCHDDPKDESCKKAIRDYSVN